MHKTLRNGFSRGWLVLKMVEPIKKTENVKTINWNIKMRDKTMCETYSINRTQKHLTIKKLTNQANYQTKPLTLAYI